MASEKPLRNHNRWFRGTVTTLVAIGATALGAGCAPVNAEKPPTTSSGTATPGEQTPSVSPEMPVYSQEYSLEDSELYNNLSPADQKLVKDTLETPMLDNMKRDFDERSLVATVLADVYKQAFIDSEENKEVAQLTYDDSENVTLNNILSANDPNLAVENVQVKIATAFQLGESYKVTQDERTLQAAILILNGVFGRLDHSRDGLDKAYARQIESYLTLYRNLTNFGPDDTDKPFKLADGTMGRVDGTKIPEKGIEYYPHPNAQIDLGDDSTRADAILLNTPSRDELGNQSYSLVNLKIKLKNGQTRSTWAIEASQTKPRNFSYLSSR